MVQFDVVSSYSSLLNTSFGGERSCREADELIASLGKQLATAAQVFRQQKRHSRYSKYSVLVVMLEFWCIDV